MSVSARTIFGAAVTAVVLIAVIAGLTVLGTPGEERGRKLDLIRMTDLNLAASAVDRYWTANGRLPETLEALAGERGYNISILDPATGQPYEYHVLEETTYELCADFALEGAEDPYPDFPAREVPGTPPGFWSHPAGRHCFRLEPKKLD